MMNVEQLILFLNLVFGSVFVYRITNKMIRTTYYRKEKLTKIGITIFCFYILLMFAVSNTYFLYIVQIVLCLFTKSAIQFYLLYSLKSLYWREFPRFLSHLRLRVQMGESFRSSVSKCLPLCSIELQHILRRIMEVVVFSQHSGSNKMPNYISETINLFKKIDRSPHLAKNLLRHSYESLMMKKSFRHKSGQILLQTHIQSFIIFNLYVFTVLYVHYNYSIFKYPKLFFASLSLMMVAFVFIFLIIRRFKWSE